MALFATIAGLPLAGAGVMMQHHHIPGVPFPGHPMCVAQQLARLAYPGCRK